MAAGIHDLIDFNNVAALLPHSGKFVLIDRIIALEGETLIAELKVRDDGLFSDGSPIPAWIGIEYMAQAVGAYVGIKSILAGEPIRLGYLLGTRRYASNVALLPKGASLHITVTEIMEDGQLGVFACEAVGKGINMSANLNVYRPP